MTDLKLCANYNELNHLMNTINTYENLLKTGNLSKITKTDKKRVLSEFIQRNPNYKNIKRNNFIIHIVF